METNAEMFDQVKITSEKHSGQTCLTVFTVENVLLLVRHLQNNRLLSYGITSVMRMDYSYHAIQRSEIHTQRVPRLLTCFQRRGWLKSVTVWLASEKICSAKIPWSAVWRPVRSEARKASVVAGNSGTTDGTCTPKFIILSKLGVG